MNDDENGEYEVFGGNGKGLVDLIESEGKKETKRENDDCLIKELNELSEIMIKNKRRTREESTSDRNYTCGCGKSYLSYPALYLHLKNKHNGKPPAGTLLPSNQNKKKHKYSHHLNDDNL